MVEQRLPASAVIIYDAGIIATYCPAVAATPGLLLTDEYIRSCFERMRASPRTFGFDERSKYVVFLQPQDRALFDVQSIAYGRIRQTMMNVYLIPDPYFIGMGGYQKLRDFALSVRLPAWSQRSSVLTWRGSVTGRGAYATIDDIPRVRLALMCREMPGTDVRLSGAHPTMQNIFPLELINEFLAANGIFGNWFEMRKFGEYKFVLDIDGHANAWGFFEKLLLGCCILKVESQYEQWFYESVRPWTHYVPVRADLSDLQEKLDWCIDNDAECGWIAGNGFKLAHSITPERALHDTGHQLLMASLGAEQVCTGGYDGPGAVVS
jgi:hypothetical protein